ncbi:MAG: ABC transporter permease [Anaerotruncus rubiinfantis]|jgi:ribose transport system permease protein
MKKTGSGALAAVKKYFALHYGIILGLVALCVITSMITPNFLKVANFVNILRQISVSGVLAISLALVLLTGGIDLSVGSTCAACGCVFAVACTSWGMNIWAGMAVTLAVAFVIGIFNGALVAYTAVPPFIITLSTQMAVRGLAYMFTGGMPIMVGGQIAEKFVKIGAGSWKFLNGEGKQVFELPYAVVIMMIVYFLVWVMLAQTRYGRHIYAIGGNTSAAEHSGINVRRDLIVVYLLSSLLAGLAGILLASRISSGQPTAANGYETSAIAAAVVGGVSFTGGTGTIGGTFIGALIMGVINNVMNLLKLDYYYQYIAQGAVIITAVLVDTYVKKSNKRARRAPRGKTPAPSSQAAESAAKKT